MATLPVRQASRVPGKMGIGALITAAVVTVVLWHLPYGNFILYPFTILATWFHEMAHGLAALLLGGGFDELRVFSDGSGVASYRGPLYLGPIGNAVVAAAGPMGPPLAGAALILASRTTFGSSVGLKLLGAVMLVSTAVWVRSPFGLAVIPVIGICLLWISVKGSERVQGFTVQFLGVQACVSTYRQIDYLFSYSAGPLGISDTAQIQQILLLPYWFWGGLMAALSFLILVQSLRMAYR
ncbi:MAG: M50 family metallopeptidase [Pseudomonadota bacterium]